MGRKVDFEGESSLGSILLDIREEPLSVPLTFFSDFSPPS